MPFERLPIRTLLLALCAASAAAQQEAPPTAAPQPGVQPPAHKHVKTFVPALNPNVILLDPAHGGDDAGAQFADQTFEKDADVAFAGRIKTLLAANGFTVLMTHTSASDQVTPDQRAEAANRSRAVACLLLHGSNGGHGVHIFAAALPSLPPDSDDALKPVLPWDTAQSTSMAQSLRLSEAISGAFTSTRLPTVAGRASVPPIDFMTCPAVAIELSQLNALTPPSDPAYQQRVAEALLTALVRWRDVITAENAAAIAAHTPKPPATAAPSTPPAPKPVKPRPVVPKVIPEEPMPDAPQAPAPIVRRPPAATPPAASPPAASIQTVPPQ